MRKSVNILFGFGLAGASAFAAAVPAGAADIYRREPVSIKDTPIEYAPPITWTGFYIGGNVGAIWPSDDVEILNDDAALIGGGHIGFNWQTPSSWVIGVEGDVNFAEEIDYLASVRARLGYAIGNTLIYGTGGVAFVGVDNVAFDDNVTGYVAGGGIEHKIRSNMSLGLEALYYDFDDAGVGALDNELDAVTVRGRLTVHMNGGPEPLK
jgi:outer membrane immunogenic protein